MNPWLYVPAAVLSAGFAYKLTLVVRLVLGRAHHLEANQGSGRKPAGKARSDSAAA